MSTKDVSVKLKSWKPQKSRRSSEDKVGTEGLEGMAGMAGMAGAGVAGMAAWHSLQFFSFNALTLQRWISGLAPTRTTGSST